jgi:thiol-disulfide isomerase/thioredoxin
MQTIEEVIDHINNVKAVMLYFYSNECAPCQILRPKVEQLITKEFPLIETTYIEGRNHPELTVYFGIFSFPVILYFFEGKEYRRYGKSVSIAEMGAEIERAYNMVFDE